MEVWPKSRFLNMIRHGYDLLKVTLGRNVRVCAGRFVAYSNRFQLKRYIFSSLFYENPYRIVKVLFPRSLSYDVFNGTFRSNKVIHAIKELVSYESIFI